MWTPIGALTTIFRARATKFRTQATLSAVALMLAAPVQSAAETAPRANTPPWFGRPYQYVVINQDVRGILAEYGRNVGAPVILSDKVQGRVRGEFVQRAGDGGNAGTFLTRLAEGNGLTWYYDGSILYVSADQEFSTQVVEVGTLSANAILGEMRRLGLMDERFAVRSAGTSGLVSVSGPPAFIAIVRQVVDKLRPPAAVAGDDPRVRVFRGGQPAELVRVQDARNQDIRAQDARASTDAAPRAGDPPRAAGAPGK